MLRRWRTDGLAEIAWFEGRGIVQMAPILCISFPIDSQRVSFPRGPVILINPSWAGLKSHDVGQRE